MTTTPLSPLTRTPANQPTTAQNQTGWKESLEVSTQSLPPSDPKQMSRSHRERLIIPLPWESQNLDFEHLAAQMATATGSHFWPLFTAPCHRNLAFQHHHLSNSTKCSSPFHSQNPGAICTGTHTTSTAPPSKQGGVLQGGRRVSKFLHSHFRLATQNKWAEAIANGSNPSYIFLMLPYVPYALPILILLHLITSKPCMHFSSSPHVSYPLLIYPQFIRHSNVWQSIQIMKNIFSSLMLHSPP